MFCTEAIPFQAIPVWMMQESIMTSGHIEWCQYCDCWSIQTEDNDWLPSCWCA
jgi:hypothetical protein